MRYTKNFKIWKADESLDPKLDLTIPKDIQMYIIDMALELKDEGYTVSYEWWSPPYYKSDHRFKIVKYPHYPHINIVKRGTDGFESIYYMNIKDFCESIGSYLDTEGYNIVIKYRKPNSADYYNIEEAIVDWGPFSNYPMCMSIHYRIEIINRDIYGDTFN